MADKFEITWEADDGYSGGSAPQRFWVDLEDLWGTEPEDLGGLFDDLIEEEFRQTVTWFSGDRERFVQWAKRRLEEAE